MTDRSYYEILGVQKTATKPEIKIAFKRLAKQYHPDNNAGDKVAQDKFQEISKAYTALSDVSKRAAY